MLPNIKTERQGKRRCGKSKARRRLEGVINKKGKVETNMLDGMVLKDKTTEMKKKEYKN